MDALSKRRPGFGETAEDIRLKVLRLIEGGKIEEGIKYLKVLLSLPKHALSLTEIFQSLFTTLNSSSEPTKKVLTYLQKLKLLATEEPILIKEQIAIINYLGTVYRKLGKFERARQELELGLKIIGNHPNSTADRASIYLNYCAVQSSLNRHKVACSFAMKGLRQTHEDLLRTNPGSKEYSHLIRILGISHFNVACELEHLRNHSASLIWYNKAIEFIGTHSDVQGLQQLLLECQRNANLLKNRERSASARTGRTQQDPKRSVYATSLCKKTNRLANFPLFEIRYPLENKPNTFDDIRQQKELMQRISKMKVTKDQPREVRYRTHYSLFRKNLNIRRSSPLDLKKKKILSKDQLLAKRGKEVGIIQSKGIAETESGDISRAPKEWAHKSPEENDFKEYIATVKPDVEHTVDNEFNELREPVQLEEYNDEQDPIMIEEPTQIEESLQIEEPKIKELRKTEESTKARKPEEDITEEEPARIENPPLIEHHPLKIEEETIKGETEDIEILKELTQYEGEPELTEAVNPEENTERREETSTPNYNTLKLANAIYQRGYLPKGDLPSILGTKEISMEGRQMKFLLRSTNNSLFLEAVDTKQEKLYWTKVSSQYTINELIQASSFQNEEFIVNPAVLQENLSTAITKQTPLGKYELLFTKLHDTIEIAISQEGAMSSTLTVNYNEILTHSDSSDFKVISLYITNTLLDFTNSVIALLPTPGSLPIQSSASIIESDYRSKKPRALSQNIFLESTPFLIEIFRHSSYTRVLATSKNSHLSLFLSTASPAVAEIIQDLYIEKGILHSLAKYELPNRLYSSIEFAGVRPIPSRMSTPQHSKPVTYLKETSTFTPPPHSSQHREADPVLVSRQLIDGIFCKVSVSKLESSLRIHAVGSSSKSFSLETALPPPRTSLLSYIESLLPQLSFSGRGLVIMPSPSIYSKSHILSNKPYFLTIYSLSTGLFIKALDPAGNNSLSLTLPFKEPTEQILAHLSLETVANVPSLVYRPT